MAKLKYDEEYYEFLDELRESGVTNMFGAGQYLVDEFAIEDDEASDILIDWMHTFSERHQS